MYIKYKHQHFEIFKIKLLLLFLFKLIQLNLNLTIVDAERTDLYLKGMNKRLDCSKSDFQN